MSNRVQEWLDGVDLVASIIYIVLIAVVVGAVLGVFFYIAWHWEASWGTQGEGFYLVVAVLLVVGWAMGQLAWLIRRRRRSVWVFDDGSEFPLPKINITPDGIKATWDADDGAKPGATQPRTWSFSFDRSGMRTFKIDAAALTTARAARAEGRSWADSSRVVNPDWEKLDTIHRSLYERALEAAVRQAAPNTP